MFQNDANSTTSISPKNWHTYIHPRDLKKYPHLRSECGLPCAAPLYTTDKLRHTKNCFLKYVLKLHSTETFLSWTVFGSYFYLEPVCIDTVLRVIGYDSLTDFLFKALLLTKLKFKVLGEFTRGQERGR